MKKVRKFVLSVLIALLIITMLPVSASAEDKPGITPVVENNISYTAFLNTYLAATDDGYMRVFGDEENEKKIIVEYYDDSFEIKSRKTIPLELKYWGGFYKGADAYYVAEGTDNESEIDSAEVIRIIKYDKNWNKLGAASITGNTEIFGGQVRYPFYSYCTEMTEYNGTLYLVTGHEGYVDPQFNQGHQGFLMVAVDEAKMKGKIVASDYWHSFSQYIDYKDSYLYVLEQSEGSRRTQISKYDPENIEYLPPEVISVLDYGGERTSARAISCFASVDGLGISSDNLLCLGTSIDQSNYDNADWNTPYNIYLTVTPISNFSEKATKVKWLTDYSDEGKGFIGAKITKVNDNRFMISWEESFADSDYFFDVSDNNDLLSYGKLHYLFVDGSGNKLTDEFVVNAPLSTCKPIVKNSEIVFYSANSHMVDFYSINSNTGKFTKKAYGVAGENVRWSLKNGVFTVSGTGSMSSAETSYVYFTDSCWRAIKDDVKKIIVKSGITDIPESEFSEFGSLKEVYIEPGLKSIGKEAFAYCGSLEKITIPSSVTSIGEDIVWSGWYWGDFEGHIYSTPIYAEKGSYAEKYAAKYDIPFVAIVDLSYGDIDGDGSVTSADALLILRASVGLELFTDEQTKYADVNGDGSVDSADSLAVLRYSVGFKDAGINIG